MPIDPLTIGAGLSLGSGLLGSLFGGDDPSEQAQKLLLKFGKEGLPPELLSQIIQQALASINQGVAIQKRGTASRLAAGGINASSGLAESQLGKASRAGLQQRGQAIGNIRLNEFGQRINALQSVAGGRPGGFNFFETLASSSANILPLLAQRGGGG